MEEYKIYKLQDVIQDIAAGSFGSNLPVSCFTSSGFPMNLPQLVERLQSDLFSVPWGHHRYIIDKCSDDSDKALFYIRQTLENGWSRDMLLNMLGTDLYECSGKAQTNFKSTLLDTDSDLAQEMTRDPYNFSFTNLRGKYNERVLKDALLTNITLSPI